MSQAAHTVFTLDLLQHYLKSYITDCFGGGERVLRLRERIEMVGPWGLEPQTSSVSRTRSNQLSYGPELGLD